jgi:hypothetical protein
MTEVVDASSVSHPSTLLPSTSTRSMAFSSTKRCHHHHLSILWPSTTTQKQNKRFFDNVPPTASTGVYISFTHQEHYSHYYYCYSISHPTRHYTRHLLDRESLHYIIFRRHTHTSTVCFSKEQENLSTPVITKKDGT